MSKGRLEAFSDGVLAVIITIMVLELKAPVNAARLSDLRPVLPVFLSYVLSFVYVGIYWNNHHHLLQATRRVNAGIMWANLHLLFWLSLTPFVSGWMGQNHFAPQPTALYGAVLLLCGAAYWILQRLIIADQGNESALAQSIGRDHKGKSALAAYAIAIPSTFISQWIAGGLYIAVALMWLIPDRRIESALKRSEPEALGAGKASKD